MTTYTLRMNVECVLDIEAEDREEARKLAEATDFYDWGQAWSEITFDDEET